MPYPKNVRGMSDPSLIKDTSDVRKYVQELQEAVVELGNEVTDITPDAAPDEVEVESPPWTAELLTVQRNVFELDNRMRNAPRPEDDSPAVLRFRYDKDNTGSGDPGTGYFRTDNNTVGSSSEIYLSHLSLDGLDIGTAMVDGMTGFSRILIGRIGDYTQMMLAKVDSLSGGSGWSTLSITVDSTALQTEWLNDAIFSIFFPLTETDVDHYTVKVSLDDTTPNYLDLKVAEGDAIRTTILDATGNEKLEFDVLHRYSISRDVATNSLELDGDVAAPLANQFYGYVGGLRGWYAVPGVGSDEMVKITAADTTASWLDDAVDEGAAILTTVVNPAADETLKFEVLYQHSITLDTDVGPPQKNHLMLRGDEASPDVYTYYGRKAGVADYGYHKIVDGLLGTAENSPTIVFDYGSTLEQWTADVQYQFTITADTSGLKLVNDEASPLEYKLYGQIVTKGWKNIDDFFQSTDTAQVSQVDDNQAEIDVQTQMSITSDISGLKLDGDDAAPGNNYFYGTEGAGTKGWNALTQISVVTDVRYVAATKRLEYKYRTAYVWNPGTEQGWDLVDGWVTTVCSS